MDRILLLRGHGSEVKLGEGGKDLGMDKPQPLGSYNTAEVEACRTR
jgi:hypothetical protein